MSMSLTDIFLSDGVARALCWTLVHSLWEGLLAAVLAGCIIGSTRTRPAILRYRLLTADLLLFVLFLASTLVYELGQQTRGMSVESMSMMDGVTVKVVSNGVGQGVTMGYWNPKTWKDLAGDYLNTHATVVSLIWLICFSIQLLRMLGGLYQVRRLRRVQITPPGEYWRERLSTLAVQMGIKKSVTLLQSGLVKVPATFGFLKPSILVPMGMLCGLPGDQVETILLHELAHIRRGDYAINLLLHLIEAILFFNPGFRWVVMLMRRERETCCDDIVLAGTPDRNSYFEALVGFAQLTVDRRAKERRSFVLQLGGGKNNLRWRIMRMLERENQKLQAMEKAVLSAGIMILVSITLISMKERVAGSAAATGRAVPFVFAVKDTVPTQEDELDRKFSFKHISSQSEENNGETNYHLVGTDDKGNSYEVREVNNRITEFRVNGTLVPAEDYQRYADVLAAVKAERNTRHRPLPPVPPVGPVGPAGPVGPGAAVGPVGPVGPLGAVGSLPPMAPTAPISPVTPPTGVGPVAPMAPAAHAAPTAPVAPVAPVAPPVRVGPVAPVPPRDPDDAEGYMSSSGYYRSGRYDRSVGYRQSKGYDGYTQSGVYGRSGEYHRPGGYSQSKGYDGYVQSGGYNRSGGYEPSGGYERSNGYKMRGRMGAVGAVGAAGPVGQVGPVGPAGPVGPRGPVGSGGPEGTSIQKEEAPTLAYPLVYTRNANPYIKSIVADMVANRLIADVSQFSFTLNADKLIVNGVQQSEDVYRTFKTKYIQHDNTHFIYSQYYAHGGSGSSCEVIGTDSYTPASAPGH